MRSLKPKRTPIQRLSKKIVVLLMREENALKAKMLKTVFTKTRLEQEFMDARAY